MESGCLAQPGLRWTWLERIVQLEKVMSTGPGTERGELENWEAEAGEDRYMDRGQNLWHSKLHRNKANV